jgi:putative membrane protein
MTRLKPIHGVAFAIALAFAGGAYAQTGTVQPDSPTRAQDRSASSTDKSTSNRSTMRGDKSAQDQLPRGERRFIEKLAQHSMAEIELGKLAEKNGSSEEVKKFGRQLVEDHTKAQEDVKKLAQAKGIDLPAELDRGHKRTLDSLQKKTGADFDRDFVRDMVKDHRSDVKDVQKEARDAKDPEVKALAAKLEPVMEKHLDMARKLEDSTKAAARKNEPSSSAGSASSRPDKSSAGAGSAPAQTDRSSSSSSNR